MQRPDIPAIAARVYRRAQDAARRKVDAGAILPSVAAAKLVPWTALAIHARADLPELEGAGQLYPSRSAWVGTLAEARDHALDRHHANPTEANEQAARDLCILANHFAFDINGRHPVPLYQPRPERRAAA